MVFESEGNIPMVKKSILKAEPKILIEKYKKVLKKNGIPVEKIILFGSYAKGTAKPWSDLDLCVVSSIFGKDSHEEMLRLMRLASIVELLIEPHPYHPKDLNDPYDALAHEINTYGKIV